MLHTGHSQRLEADNPHDRHHREDDERGDGGEQRDPGGHFRIYA